LDDQRAGKEKVAAAARAVDMLLRLDTAKAVPTYPQLQ
jgi:hypothetical protein